MQITYTREATITTDMNTCKIKKTFKLYIQLENEMQSEIQDNLTIGNMMRNIVPYKGSVNEKRVSVRINS